MDLGLQGKVALVTAASKGIGWAVVHTLASEGARVAMNSSHAGRLAEAFQSMGEVRANITTHPSDLTKPEAVGALVDAVIAAHGRIDVLVVNTPGPRIAPFVETTLEDWANAYETLVRPAVQLALSAIPLMVKQRGGSIVFLTSTWVKQPMAGGVLSASMRSAISALCKQLALELAPHKIRVNQVMPGATGTDRMKAIIAAKASASGVTEEEVLQNMLRDIPLARWAEPEEIARAVAFLASPVSDFVTGVAFHADGGAIRSTL